MNPDSVIFVERIVPNYRVPFFLGLHEALNKQDICLRVLGGKCLPQEHLVDAIHELPFGEQIHNIYFHHGIYLQQGLHDHIKGIRLIITGQENRALSINRLLLQQQFSQIIPPIAFYDHGPVADTKSISSAVNYAVKKALSLRANWWFAYTEISKCRLIRCGFDPSRITVANNAIDTKQILAAQQHADLMQLTSSYNKLFNDNISDIQKVIIGIVCMRLVAGKKVDFLLSTLDFIHKEVENFRMLIIGEGTKKQVIQNYCSTRPWCKYLGALYGGERIPYFVLADCWLNPGTVGLTILDAFASSAPLFTTTSSHHGPEIAYLKNNINGVIANSSISQYAQSVITVIKDPCTLRHMQDAAGQAALKYSLSAMVLNFSSGVMEALRKARHSTLSPK